MPEVQQMLARLIQDFGRFHCVFSISGWIYYSIIICEGTMKNSAIISEIYRSWHWKMNWWMLFLSHSTTDLFSRYFTVSILHLTASRGMDFCRASDAPTPDILASHISKTFSKKGWFRCGHKYFSCFCLERIFSVLHKAA